MEEEMRSIHKEFRYYLQEVRRYMRQIFIICLMFGLIGSAFAITRHVDRYEAVSIIGIDYFSGIDQLKDSSSVIQGYIKMAEGKAVCERVAIEKNNANITYKEIQDMLDVSISTTSSIVFTVKATNREDAIRIVNAVVDSFLVEMKSISSTDFLKILEKADSATKVQDQLVDIIIYGLGSSILVFVSSVLFLMIRATKRNMINTIDTCNLNGKVDILGVLPKY